jgi:16S rRNA (cytidine1402-2'-O)-methyltransferase
MTGTLYLVATPIGNLQDITLRAIETLKAVDVIACEDTRHTRKLLTHFGITNKLVSYHEHNETERAEELGKMLATGKSVAVVSDAGTPAICDPSFKLVQKAHEIGVPVVPVPGAVAFVNAVIASGLPTDSIFFGGFLPSRKTERRRRLEEVKDVPATIAFYESPHRLAKSLADCFEILGDRPSAIARELTKIHEEIIRGTLSQLVEKFSDASLKGEIVLVIERVQAGGQIKAAVTDASLADRIKEIEAGGIDRKTALKKAAKEFGLSKSEAYRIMQAEKE